MNTNDIRNYFCEELKNKRFIIDKTGQKTLEMLGASFIADEPSIFGKLNKTYINAEIEWYLSRSNNINGLGDIYGKIPKAWEYTANEYGEINSNYGHIIFSEKYYNQFDHVINELLSNRDTRRAQLIYNRPSIWIEYNENGKNDFICTNAQTVYIRDNKLHMVSQMRSNDVWAGYRNDYAWAKYLMEYIVNRYNVLNPLTVETFGPVLEVGDLYWQVMNLHCYEKDFYLIEEYNSHE